MSEVTTAPSVEVAQAFFDACETGKGWEVCQQFCTPDAGFSAQAEPLDDIDTLEQYTDWMKGLLTLLSDAGYELKSFAADKDRGNVMAYGVFSVPTPVTAARCRRPGKARRRTTST